MTPSYQLNIGPVSIDSSQPGSNAIPIEILVARQLNMINSARLTFGFPLVGSFAVGATVAIELGATSSQQVFSGIVQEMKRAIQGYTIYCTSTLANLTSTRLNKLYEKQKAGDIVNDLAQLAGVTTGSVENGLEYPVYVLGNDRNMFDHILELARRNGFDCYADADDNLVFARYLGRTIHQFQYGVNILELKLDDRPVQFSGVEIYGASPSSLGQGKDAYSWLTKQEVKGSAGTTTGTIFQVVDPALKDLDAAGLAAESIWHHLAKTRSGVMVALGNSEVKLGDAMQISDMPDSNLDGTYKITGIKHKLNKQSGFITTIDWTEV